MRKSPAPDTAAGPASGAFEGARNGAVDSASSENGQGIATKSRFTPLPSASAWLIAAVIVAVGTFLRLLLVSWAAERAGSSLGAVLGKWDAKYYLGIAEYGYFNVPLAVDVPVHEQTLAFFPGFPLLIRAVHAITNLDYAAAAMAINAVATVCLVAGAMRLARGWGAGAQGQVAAGIVVSCLPMSIVFTMPYSDVLFFALAVWALVALNQQRWVYAAGLIMCAGTVRLTAIALVAALAITVLRRGKNNIWAWGALVCAPGPFVAYLWWASAQLESAGGYFGIQKTHWNSAFDFGVASARWVGNYLFDVTNPGYWITAVTIVAAPLALAITWRLLDWPTRVFCLVLLANVELSDGIMHSRPRLLLPLALTVVAGLVWLLRSTGWRGRLRSRGWLGWAGLIAWVAWGTWVSVYMLVDFDWAI